MGSIGDSLPETSKVINSGIERGLHTGLQLYVSRGGNVVVDAGGGESSPGTPMTAESIMMWLSAGKPLAAVAILQLVEQGLLNLDGRIVDWIPEFAAGGKERIQLHHLLTHTGGFRNVESGWPQLSWEETLDRIYESPLEVDWRVGETAGYHTSSSWYILGELIQRVDPKGRDFSRYFRDEICEPLGMQYSWNGMPSEFWSANKARIAEMSQLEKGRTELLPWHDEQHCVAASPGANSRGPIRELGRFYECLLAGGELDGRRILSEESVELLTTRHREGIHDQTLMHKVDFGLGVILDSNRYGVDTVPYGFSPYCSERTFGHGGSQSSIGFADPEAELVVCYVANCRVGEPRHQKRNREIVSAIYRDLGLADHSVLG
ncbi:MAG: CubicO group peptidase (beta-lactamase class C family) [Planctomycetaceae bacterium]|jgi:CubicO group peptidase (beta-lactamase class C family)